MIGSTIAIGLRNGNGIGCIPLEDGIKRDAAVKEVEGLYQDFIDNFGSSNCSTLIDCDFGKPGEYERYHKEQLYMNTCLRFFEHVMQRFISADKEAEA